jgi:ribosome-associated protein
MKHDIPIKNGIVIPESELEITTSRAGGPGGQYVNRTSSRVTLRWNVKSTNALTEEQKTRVLQKLQSQLTTEGDLIIHNSASRSQEQNKEAAFELLAEKVRQALYVPKKRTETKIPGTIKEARLQTKKQRSMLKKMRSKKHGYDE